MDWLKECPLSESASAVRRTLSPVEYASIRRAIENFALITHRPLAEIAERVLISTQAMVEGEGSADFMAFLADILGDHDDAR